MRAVAGLALRINQVRRDLPVPAQYLWHLRPACLPVSSEWEKLFALQGQVEGSGMRKRDFLKSAGAYALAAAGCWNFGAAKAAAPGTTFSRVRPGDPGWPSQVKWNGLNEEVQGRLIKLSNPLDVCRAAPDGEACKALFDELRNPYFISE